MIKKFNKKILIMFIVTLLVSVFFVTTITFLIVNTQQERSNKSAKVDAVVYDLRSYSDDYYDECDEYKITDEYGLTMLAKAVNEYGRSFLGENNNIKNRCQFKWF